MSNEVVSEGVSEVVSNERVSEWASEERVSEWASEVVSERVSNERVSEWASEVVSERVSNERVSEWASERVSERVSNERTNLLISMNLKTLSNIMNILKPISWFDTATIDAIVEVSTNSLVSITGAKLFFCEAILTLIPNQAIRKALITRSSSRHVFIASHSAPIHRQQFLQQLPPPVSSLPSAQFLKATVT